ncbi:diaminopimelate epimerase [Oceanidesulfovibrio marinus]|uniref:Diaminopimelate epimerase n=1 Tax=Oceanidesulfovibrio marinus TaxID=370038 RepID=A0A6P1ZCQ3_9BACT|nr:diaminopimelate epimerase [Oceanidesulfovibrio marinus]QJT11224.1 diaminopimelate epimerase [Oceanidesulfovibrio marinus]TVM30468.1 diaminopimelate epimerase [Oceanidesulfovibrio marinus]
MQGCGNDFVFIDNRELGVPVSAMADWACAICPRAFRVGADGAIFLENAPEGSEADYIWHFYNADGSRAEMCGNASRCAARLAARIGLAPAQHVLGTDAGPIKAEADELTGRAKVQLTPPKNLELGITITVDGKEYEVHHVDTGVPHTVLLFDDVSSVDVAGLGRAIRFHERFAPAGTNVNFLQVTSPERLELRTYERGVEAETLACGTGAAASAVIANALGRTGDTAEVCTTGKEILTISLENGDVFLEGAASFVYRGEFDPKDLGLSL